MPKRLRDEPIYLAPEILAYRGANNAPCVVDERTGRSLDPSSIDDKICIYERQVKEWFLERAKSFLRGRYSKYNGFAVMMIATSYIEGVEQYRKGRPSNGESKAFFVAGMKRIFGYSTEDETNLKNLYTHLRCGLFHNGMSGDAVVLSRKFSAPLTFSNRGTMDINPTRFLNAVCQDFEAYVKQLRNSENIELRIHFGNMFNVV